MGKMKLSVLVCALFASSAAAFSTPSTSREMTMSATWGRREAFVQIAGAAAAVVPFAANADGAVSAASIGRARGIYGNRIAALEKAVDAGDFRAVAEEKSAFILFNSGAYPFAKDKSKKSDAISGTNAIFAAVRSKDKGALKSAYQSYIASNGISSLPEISADDGQGYSNDYDYRARTKAGAIYVR